MMIKIWRGNSLLLEVPICIGSKVKKELMVEDSINLVFALDNAIRLYVGDTIDDERFGLYILTEDYLPVYYVETGGFDYKVRFDAYYYIWNTKFLKYYSSAASELSFNLTGNINVHLSVILENLNSLGYKYKGLSYTLNIDSSLLSESKAISYQNIHIWDALMLIAETYECECWVEYNIIYFGKCYNVNDFVFEVGNTVSTMTPSSAEEKYGTRLYVYGSERNLPKNYRQGTGTVNAVVQKRLMLPEGIPYLDSREGLTNDTAVEFVKTFDDIYPKTDGIITSVSTYEDTVEEEGNSNTEVFYRFKDSSIRFSEDYLLPSELAVLFTSGALNGMQFAVRFNPLGVAEKNTDGTWNDEAQLFEIIANEDYGRKLPDDVLKPKKGDKYILLNWDSTKLEDLGLVEKAENDLLEAGKTYLKQIDTDSKVYTCSMMSDVAKSMYLDNIHTLLNVGDSVILKNDIYFPVSTRYSRIIGYEYNMDYPFDSPTYTVGESPKYSRLKTIESEVNSIIYKDNSEKINISSANEIYVISRKDKTPATDNNVYSSLRSQLEFLRKNIEDSANERITFEKGLISKMTSYLEDVILKNAISSTQFVNGLSGFRLIDNNGISELEVDKLFVRQIMTVVELVIQKMRSVGGKLVVSAADGKIKSVNETDNSYILAFEDVNLFVENDLIRCQTFTGKNIKSYWVRVEKTGENYVEVQKSEFDGYSLPEVGDEVVLMGNTQNTFRQNIITISATEDGQPRIDILNGIKSKNLTNCLRTRLGNLDGIIDEHFGDKQPQGDGLYSDNAYLKGDFILRKTGESVETRFEVTDGNIKSAVGTLQDDASNGKTLLYNPSFAKGVRGWITNARAKYYTYNGLPIFIGDSAFVDSTNGIAAHYLIDGTMVYVNGRTLVDGVTEKVESKYNDSRFYFRLYDGEIKQLNDNFINKPDINGFVPITLELKIDVSKEGVLYSYIDEVASTKATTYKGISDKEYLSEISISTPNGAFSFSGISETIGEEDVICVSFDNGIKLYNLSRKREVLFDTYYKVIGGVELNTPISLFVFEAVKKTKEYIHLKFETKWDGIGNFVLGFTGDAKLYSLQLYTDNTEVRYSTLFEQTERVISATAAMYGENNELLKKSGLVVQAEGAGLYAKDKDGNQAIIATYTTEKEGSKILLEGDKIQLKGNLTTDGNFKVREDGSIEARNGLFSGILRYIPLEITDETRETYMELQNASSNRWKLKKDYFTNILLYKAQQDAFSIDITLPSITSYSQNYEINFLRGLVGQKCAVYNYREAAALESADIKVSYTTQIGNMVIDTLPKGNFSVYECVLGIDANNKECIYWKELINNGLISDYSSQTIEPNEPIQPTDE